MRTGTATGLVLAAVGIALATALVLVAAPVTPADDGADGPTATVDLIDTEVVDPSASTEVDEDGTDEADEVTDRTEDEEPTEIDSCTRIDEPGTYVLTGDIEDDDEATGEGGCLFISASNVTIDGQGHVVEGTGNGTGIDVALQLQDPVVRNLTVRNFQTGVDLTGPAPGITLRDVEITDNTGAGIVASWEGSVELVDSEVRDNAGDGIEGVQGSFAVRNSVVADNGGSGVNVAETQLFEGGSNVIEDSRIVGNGDDGVRARWLLTVENSTFSDNGGNGISYGARGVTVGTGTLQVTDSVVTDNGDDGIAVGSPFTVGEDLTVEIHRNVVADNDGLGIHVSFESRNPGVNATAGETPVNATHNYWGASDGPSSEGGEPLQDPITGALANGSGDAVSNDSAPGYTMVHFDPFLTEDPREEPDDGEGEPDDGDDGADDGDDQPVDGEDGDAAVVHYQIDLAVGHPIEHVGPAGEGSFYGDQERLVRNVHGSTEEPFERSGTGGPRSLAADHAECVTYEDAAVENDTATVTFTVAEDCERTITLASYVKPGPGFDRSMDQDLHDATTDTFGPGTHTITVDLPGADDEDGDE